MDKIVVIFSLGDYEQTIAIYKSGKGVELDSAPADELVDKVIGLCKEFSISNVDLVGNNNHLEKYKADFLTRYDLENSLNVNIVAR